MTVESLLSAFPPALGAIARAHWDGFCARSAEAGLPVPGFDDDTLHILLRAFAGSDYVAQQCARRPAMLHELVASGELARPADEGGIRARVAAAVAPAGDDDALMAALRAVRHREMVRIIVRDLAGAAVSSSAAASSRSAAPLGEVVADLSALADACLREALDKVTAWCERDAGTPVGEHSGKPQRLVVIGMGKLGAGELNLSSDIDLIFAYPEEGETQGMPRVTSNHEFFTRVGRRLIKVIDTVTDDGFVFRVDMRLRPWGASGALAAGFEAMESYYEQQGRPWERYALIKARIVAGDTAAGTQLLAALRPFVYRRYLDFSAFASLRELKAMIVREVKRKGMEADVKLGPGGIREIEFIAQSFQLIRGGVDARLQQRALLPVLDVLAEMKLVAPSVRDELVAANDFLRRTEHRLQAIADAQTQALPDDDLARTRIAFAMGFADWPSFMAVLDAHRANVERHFREVVAVPGGEEGTNGEDAAAREEEAAWLDLWLGQSGRDVALATLSASGIGEPEVVLARIDAFRDERAVVHLQAISRERLDRLMPALLRGLSGPGGPGGPDGQPAPDAAAVTLSRVLGVVSAVLRRSAYMVLLTENPGALAELIRLCGASEWIAAEIARHPSLLDELLNTGTLYAPPKLDALRADLRAQLARIPQEDTEALMEALRHFRLAHVLKVAASDVMGTLPLMKVSDYLTWIAEALLGEVLAMAWHELVGKHGAPGREDGTRCDTGFVIIGYGKFGGIELSYGSDLDLVFLYDAPPDGTTDGARELSNEGFYTRLVQRIISLITTRTFSGALYEVDMRLRPSGASGLLVSSIDAFAKYQREAAWTWEHQALVRARPVAGDPAVAGAFERVRQDILACPREPAALAGEVVAMRDRMIAHLSLAADRQATDAQKAALFDIKQDPGGIVDIEFLVQYLVLRGAAVDPGLARYSDNVRQLEAIAAAGLLSPADAECLREAYLLFRSQAHRQALLVAGGGSARVDAAAFAAPRADVRRLWTQVFGGVAPVAPGAAGGAMEPPAA